MGGIFVAVAVAGFFLLRKPNVPPTTSGMPVPGTENVEEKKVVNEEDNEPITEIEVSADEYSYSPSFLSVKKGDKVRIVFTNKGNLPHNLVIDELGISTKTIVSGKSDTIEFTAEGDMDLEFYCSIGNHKSLGMEGKIKVE